MLRSVRLTDETENYIKEIQKNLKQKLGLEENISDIIRVSIVLYHDYVSKIKSNKTDTS